MSNLFWEAVRAIIDTFSFSGSYWNSNRALNKNKTSWNNKWQKTLHDRLQVYIHQDDASKGNSDSRSHSNYDIITPNFNTGLFTLAVFDAVFGSDFCSEFKWDFNHLTNKPTSSRLLYCDLFAILKCCATTGMERMPFQDKSRMEGPPPPPLGIFAAFCAHIPCTFLPLLYT